MHEAAFRVAVLMLPSTPLSIRVYVEEILLRLPALGVQPRVFDRVDAIPSADLLWDPRTGGGRAPTPELLRDARPLVVTLHDVAHLSLRGREFYKSRLESLEGWVDGLAVKRRWRAAGPRLVAVICPSEVTRAEAGQHLRIATDRFVVIPHGVDHERFSGQGADTTGSAGADLPGPYFLHVSHYQPRKNIERIVAAHAALPPVGRPSLVMKIFGHPNGIEAPGVRFIGGELSRSQIATLYRHALAFVFPSLNEGFGLPILEAMVSGCAVITSQGTACSEVAADAALLVDPRSVASITEAMRRLWQDEGLRSEHARRGRQQSRLFTWEAAAARHADVFRQALSGCGPTPPGDLRSSNRGTRRLVK